MNSAGISPYLWVGTLDGEAAEFNSGATRCRALPFSGAEINGYYEGIGNTVTWPMYHEMPWYVPEACRSAMASTGPQ